MSGNRDLYVVGHPDHMTPNWANTTHNLDWAHRTARESSATGLRAVAPLDGPPVAVYFHGRRVRANATSEELFGPIHHSRPAPRPSTALRRLRPLMQTLSVLMMITLALDLTNVCHLPEHARWTFGITAGVTLMGAHLLLDWKRERTS